MTGSAIVPYSAAAAQQNVAAAAQAAPGMQIRSGRFGDRYVGPGGNVIHLEGRLLDSEPASITQGGAVDNAGQRCRACGQDGHLMFECPVLRGMFKSGKVTREGHPI